MAAGLGQKFNFVKITLKIFETKNRGGPNKTQNLKNRIYKV